MKISLDWLKRVAQEEVIATLESLPKPLQAQARHLPVTYEPVPCAELVRDGIEPDTLGLFVGSAFADEAASLSPIPPQIILFLQNLWDMAEEDEAIYREEIHTTLLHELGHYLGLDEEELFDRGLE